LRENGLRENGLRENGLRENGLRENGFTTTAFKTWFDKDRARAANVMQYVAKCALRADQALAYTDGGGASYRWPGSLGLAPGWNARAATVAEQEWVSACLMAFTNKCGNNVTISLRGPTEGAPETERFPLEAGEAAGWSYQEAAFFGNLFDAAGPDSNGCDGGGGNSFVQVGLGRECGSDNKNCGYKAQGPCSSKCTISTNADKYYKSCTANGKTYSRVITTYLDPTTWRGAMDCRNKELEDNQLTLGWDHACARKSNGQLACWGDNTYGQLGDGTRTGRPTAVTLSLGAVVQVSAAGYTTCARFENGATKCWGKNDRGQLGSNSTVASSTTPVSVSGLQQALYAMGGAEHVCSLSSTGGLSCWGDNNSGQLGSTEAMSLYYTTAPTPVAGLTSNVAEVAPGAFHTCARRADNTVYCWGVNNYGQLGDNTFDDHYTAEPTLAVGNVVQIALGTYSTCARLVDGQVKCWGDGTHGQLGSGSSGAGHKSATPLTVAGAVSKFAKIASGSYHVCGLAADRSVHCWGKNDFGQLGDGTTTRRATATRVPGLNDVVDLVAGEETTCVRRATGAISCWGLNNSGQLGIGSADWDPHPVPVRVVGF
jgi:alpha-tubulin suppressor-like RCC1 family protein